jgi:glutathione S-transferase
MILYGNPLSPNSRKAHVTALLARAPVEFRVVDLMGGGTRAPDYLAMNPNGKVPTLVDGDFVLWESNAISQYIASRHPESGLWPADDRIRADISRWQCWELAHWAHALHILVWERVVKKMMNAGDPDPAAVAKGEAAFHTLAKVLDSALAGRRYVVGSSLTLADISLASQLIYASAASVPVNDYPSIAAWFERVEGLEAWQQTAPQPK